MSRQINLPINQVRLTNVAVVRMQKGGKRFEIACYRNKVVDYRQGLEQDLSEVLQTDRVFKNVSKGEFANIKDLQKVFGTKDEEEIAKVILTKGQLQVGSLERNEQLEKTIAQIAEWISKNCVHPASDRPYTISQIKHAMSQANFSVHPTKPLKRQYLDCVKTLQGVIPIRRAKMELLLLVPDGEHPGVEDLMNENKLSWEHSLDGMHQYKILVDPSLYRILNEEIQKIEGARIEVVTQVVTKQGDVNLEADLVAGHSDAGNCDEKIEEQSSKLRKMKIVDVGDKQQSSGSDSDEVDLTANRRKQQQKARRKNQKAKRRDTQEEEEVAKSEIPAAAQQSQPMQAPAGSSATGDANDERKSCNTCGGFFDAAAAYRSHFKSDWHKFNQKLKMKGVAPVSEQEFLLCDSDTFFGGDMM